MEIILHIGMGKTGTSSIQKALALNRDRLAGQNVDCLGIWFGAVADRIRALEQRVEEMKPAPRPSAS